MNERIRKLARDSHIDVYALGKDHSKWEEVLDRYTKSVVADCIRIVEGYCETSPEIYGLPLDILEHFDMELEDE